MAKLVITKVLRPNDYTTEVLDFSKVTAETDIKDRLQKAQDYLLTATQDHYVWNVEIIGISLNSLEFVPDREIKKGNTTAIKEAIKEITTQALNLDPEVVRNFKLLVKHSRHTL